jgi:hypothetical protein
MNIDEACDECKEYASRVCMWCEVAYDSPLEDGICEHCKKDFDNEE